MHNIGMPHDTYNIWFPASYPLNQSFCILQGLLSETSTNATVLTITSFTIERYIGSCFYMYPGVLTFYFLFSDILQYATHSGKFILIVFLALLFSVVFQKGFET